MSLNTKYDIHVIANAIIFILLIIFLPVPIHAAEVSSQSGTIVSATIQDQSFGAPALIAPSNNSVTNNPQEPFSWHRPVLVPSHITLDHYDFYLDGVLHIQGIKDNLIKIENNDYVLERIGDIFYLYPKVNLSEGYHTWRVNAYSTVGVSSGTGIWTFYVDSITPFIKVTAIDSVRPGYDSRDPTSIPPLEQRFLYVSADPRITGEVEPGANLQFTLLCPIGVSPCTGLTQTYNYPDGIFNYRFYNLLPNKAYPIFLSSTDAAGNSTTLPVFYLIHLSGLAGIIYPLFPPAVPPSIVPLPSPTTAPIPPEVVIPPIEILPVPPVSPTPPPLVPEKITKAFNPLPLILLLLIFGLPLHLGLAQYGTNTKFSLTHKFLFILLYPFIGRKKFTTHPFTTIDIYNSNNPDKSLALTVSDCTGRYSVPEDLPTQLLVRAFNSQKEFKPHLLSNYIFTHSCLFLMPLVNPSAPQRLQKQLMSIRSLPLALGVVTSGIALFIYPSIGLLFYLYLCLQAVFSEYLYPHLL